MVELDVIEDVPVPDMVPLPVDVPLIETVLVVLPVFVLLGEFEGLDPNVMEVVGETVIDGVSIPVLVKEGVTDGVCDDDEVGESLADCVWVGEFEAVTVPLPVALSVADSLSSTL